MKVSKGNKKYSIIYADPPWPHKALTKNGIINRGVAKCYRTMTINELYNLPIGSIKARNCVLFIWINFPFLSEALQVINGWGFTYKTLGFSWIKFNKQNKKPCFGMGYYTRSNCEVCLIGTYGKPKIINHSISSVIMSTRYLHSKKPNIVRDSIVALY